MGNRRRAGRPELSLPIGHAQVSTQNQMEENILEIRNLKKAFEGVMAVDDVSFSVRRGEVHALMGQNGAGKSTVIKIISGIHKADSGEVIYDGKKCSFSNALGAQHAGISTVYQELNMIPALSVSENIFLGRYPFDAWGIDWKAMHAAAQSLVSDLEVGIDVRKPLAEFGAAKKQIIYILRAISLKSKLIVMDEPTSSLDTNEVEMLFGIIDKLKSASIAVIFITHRLDEVYRRCDRVTILKDGRSEGTYAISELSQYELLEKMVGRNSLALEYKRTRRDAKGDGRVLEVKNISRVPYVRNVSFELIEEKFSVWPDFSGLGERKSPGSFSAATSPIRGKSWSKESVSTCARRQTPCRRGWPSAPRTEGRRGSFRTCQCKATLLPALSRS